MRVIAKPNCLFSAEELENDSNGRFIILRLKIGDNTFNVVNIYAPTDYREQLEFIDLPSMKIISLTDTSNLIIAGDWNTTLNAIDKQGGLPWKETNLIYFMKEDNLVDIYRVIHPKTITFTYESKTKKLKSRLDFFFFSKW